MRAWLTAGAISVSLAVIGCTRGPAQTPNTAAASGQPLSPHETITSMLEARRAGDYRRIESLTHPDAANAVADTLMAVDEFLAANEQLCETIRDHIGVGLAQTIDQSQIAANLDIFSKYVELLDESRDGDRATVSFLVDGKLPAKTTKLQRLDGKWYYDPGPGYAPQLPAAFRRMARGLRQVTEEIKTGGLDAGEVRENPDRLIEEVRIRILPGVKLLPPPPDSRARGGG